jgi:hypothetical protein
MIAHHLREYPFGVASLNQLKIKEEIFMDEFESQKDKVKLCCLVMLSIILFLVIIR